MIDNISEARLRLVLPQLADIIRHLGSDFTLAFPGQSLRVTFGVRSWAGQAALFAQGRDTLAQVNYLRGLANLSPITAGENTYTVTNAAPGYSWHQFAMAVDVVPMTPAPDWKSSHWPWIVSRGIQLGLRNGISWHDEPHFQLTGQWGDTPTDEVRQLFKDGGVKAVWHELIL